MTPSAGTTVRDRPAVAGPLGEAEEPATRDLLVRQATWEAEGVISLRLVDPDGGDLPEWEPGAHLELILASGLVRQYSLCGDPADRRSYTVAVLLEEDGRGGSREIHETVTVGRTVAVRGPRNRFPLVDAADYLLVAGGIGITPILSMVRSLAVSGASWRLVYGGRSRRSMAFVSELYRLGTGRVDLVPQDERGMLDLDTVLAELSPPTVVYCCGPEGLIRAVEQRCEARTPALDVHVERFAAASRGESAAGTGVTDGSPGLFEVELRRSGHTVMVPADRTILDVVRDVVPDVPSSCEEGFCGTCETTVLEGDPEHHDTILTPREREAGATMMICVGRSRSRRLVLDL